MVAENFDRLAGIFDREKQRRRVIAFVIDCFHSHAALLLFQLFTGFDGVVQQITHHDRQVDRGNRHFGKIVDLEMQINILFPGRIALLVEDRVNNRVVCIHQQDALGLAHLQLVKITLRRLRITVCQHIRECKQIAAELVRHFALCLVGIAQRLDIGALHLGALMCNGQCLPHLGSGFQLIQQKQRDHIDRAHHKQAKRPCVIFACGTFCVEHPVKHKQCTQWEQC